MTYAGYDVDTIQIEDYRPEWTAELTRLMDRLGVQPLAEGEPQPFIQFRDGDTRYDLGAALHALLDRIEAVA